MAQLIVQMALEFPVLFSFLAYLLLILIIGLAGFRQTSDLGDYLLGGRRLGPVVTALSAGASDMSGWLLLGLPGAIYLSGIREAWIGIGLVIGAWCNWLFVSKRLRVYSHFAGNSLTLPDYLENRFHDKSRVLRLLSASVILLFFTFYTASGLVGGAILFEHSFGFDYRIALFIGAVIIVSYTFMGGFLAVCWTDALQAMLMLVALIIGPLMVVGDLGGPSAMRQTLQTVDVGSTNLFADFSLLGVVSLLAWGLGYMGQPHILARFMAVQDHRELPAARRIAMTWMITVLLGSVLTGLAGMAYFSGNALENPETVFISLSRALFNPWIAGIIAAAILSAIMSTIDSQLLVCSSVISEDFYRVFLRPGATEKELLLVSRLAVIAVALLALVIASDRNSRVLDLVSYAWAGFGAAFGPVILFSLFWRRMTAHAAIAGMAVGAITVLLWAQLEGGLFDLYEIVPGFLLGSLAIVLTTSMRPQAQSPVLDEFAEFARRAAAD